MNKKALNVLRIGLALTFVWIGAMIIQNPEAWSKMIQPWVLNFIPSTWLNSAMLATGLLDIAIGLLLSLNILTWLVALIGSLHLIVVLVTVGLNETTVRDIGLLGATIALTLGAKNNKIQP